MTARLHLGLIINPLAGLGGALALKGSDGEALREAVKAFTPEQRRRAEERVRRAFKPLRDCLPEITFSTWQGAMGGQLLDSMDISATIPHETQRCSGKDGKLPLGTSGADTQRAARSLQKHGVDLLVFAGGDGTARDIFDAIGTTLPSLGIPCGVKMHSGVFAVSPEAAGELLEQLVAGGLVGLRAQEVRDIDEQAFREDRVRTRYYGELMVPSEGQYLQQTKIGGRESPELVAIDIAAWIGETLDPESLVLVGPGSTTATIMQELGLPNTLLGVDAVHRGQVILADADERGLLKLLAEHKGPAEIIVTAIGGQGHIFGRGNQQFSPEVIRRVGQENITIVAAKSKIAELQGRPLLIDTNDPALDAELCGYRRVITGYDDQVLYRVGRL